MSRRTVLLSVTAGYFVLNLRNNTDSIRASSVGRPLRTQGSAAVHVSHSHSRLHVHLTAQHTLSMIPMTTAVDYSYRDDRHAAT